jgi:autotransporter-associated beta strand protein
MSLRSWWKWLTRRSRPFVKSPVRPSRKPRSQPQVERLEDRLVPANDFWKGTVNNLWSNPNNWSDPNSSIAHVPGPADTAVFDGTGNTPSTIDQPFTIGALDIRSGYTQTITDPSALTLTMSGTSGLGTGNFSQAAGSTFTVTSNAVISVDGNWFERGTFNAGGGLVTFTGFLSTQTLDSGGQAFNNVTRAGGATLQLTGSPLTVNGTLDAGTGTIDLNGQNATAAAIAGTSTEGGAGTITNTNATPAILTVSNAAADTFGGLLTGNLSLTKTNTGNLVLTNTNTYTQATTLAGGTLSNGVANALPVGTNLVGSGGTFDLSGFNQEVATVTGTGTVTDSGQAATLTVNNALNETFAGQLAGSLALTKSNTGTLSLTGGNSFSGGSTVLAGTLAVGADANLGSGPVTIGSATLEATGTFVSNRTYTVDSPSSTIQVDGSQTLTVTGPVVSGGSTGGGGLVKTGTGTLVLAGTASYPGQTSVQAGLLLVNGSVSGGVTVNPGATLGGNGSIAGTTAISDGSLFPPSGSTFALQTSDIQFSSGSTFNEVINGLSPGSGFNELIAGGSVSLGGQLAMSLGTVIPSGASFTIISAPHGTISGTFSNIPSGNMFSVNGRCFAISYNTNSVVLTELSPNAFFVMALYRDVLERHFDQPGLNAWVQALDSGQLTRFQVATAFRTSAEFRGLEVDQLYKCLLGRAADPVGRAAWVNALNSGVSEAEAVIAFVNTPEFTAHAPDSVSFLEDIYQCALERSPNSAEIAALAPLLNNGAVSRTTLTELVLSSPEIYGLAVTQNYQEFLHHLPSGPDQQAIINQITSGQLSSVSLTALILSSDEYFALAQEACPPLST